MSQLFSVMLFAAVGQRGSDRTFDGKSQVNMLRSPATVAATPTAARKSNVSFNDLDPEPIHGPYRFQVKHETITSDLFDPSDQGLEIWYPDIAGSTFPLVSYAHGMGGGGALLSPGYFQLLNSIAGFGYVVVAPRACNLGCAEDRLSLPRDPPNFGNWYKQQLLAIDWAKNTSNPLSARINHSPGVGIAGHSMGGQATLYSASNGHPEAYDIRAAVMHHPFTHSYPSPTIPHIVFTGQQDRTATPEMAESIFQTECDGCRSPKMIANKLDSGHHAPDTLGYDPLLPQFTAAWFKLYLDRTPEWEGIDFRSMIVGNDEKRSICKGGFGVMVEKMCTFKER